MLLTKKKDEKKENRVENEVKSRHVVVPKAEVYKGEASITLRVELPGVTKEDVQVMIENNILTIEGKAKNFKDEKFTKVYQEFYQRDYKRAFELTTEVEEEKIEAKVEDGVLNLSLPLKKPETKTIEIK